MIVLNSTKECQEFWNTSLETIYIPSKYINTSKKAPIGTFIAMILLSNSKEITAQEKSTRIITATQKNMTRLENNLVELRKVKRDKVKKDISKLLELNTKEFKYKRVYDKYFNVTLKYYEIKNEAFVTIDIKLIHYLLEKFKDNEIQIYIALKWICKNGWTQITQEQLAEIIGLSKHSYRIVTKIINNLCNEGLIQKKSQYRTITFTDFETGKLKSVQKPYFEYRVKEIEEFSIIKEFPKTLNS